MKRFLQLALLLVISTVAANAQWTNGQAATRVIGQPDFTSSTAGTSATTLNATQKVAIDFINGKMYVADSANSRVLRYAFPVTSNQPQAEMAFGQADLISGQPNRGTGAVQSWRLANPTGVVVKNGTLWVADYGNNRILKFNQAYLDVMGTNEPKADAVLGQSTMNGNAYASTPATQNGMARPSGVAIDSLGNLYVSDNDNDRVLRFDNANAKANGANADVVLGQANFAGSDPSLTQAGMNTPKGVSIDHTGYRLYVADAGNNRVLRFEAAYSKTNGANADGVYGQPDFTTGAANTTQSGMRTPYDVSVDGSGALYVADADNNRILIFTSAASKTDGANADYVLGQSDFVSSAPGTTASTLRMPRGVFVDNAGQLYVGDSGNNRVLGFDANTPLPVELVGFMLTPKSNSVAVEWSTGSEVNNAGFEILRADQETGFVKIASYLNNEALRGLGTDAFGKKYAFTDENVKTGTYTYKLVDVALDGKRTEHDAKSVVIEEAAMGSRSFADVSPNPAIDYISVKFFVQNSADFYTVGVYTALGEKVYSTVSTTEIGDGQNMVNIPVKGLSEGTYFVHIAGSNGTAVKSFVVSR